jgi:hypothetical protein
MKLGFVLLFLTCALLFPRPIVNPACINPKFPISMSEKWLIAREIGRLSTVAYWVR